MTDEVSFGHCLTLLSQSARADDVAVIFVEGNGQETALSWQALEARANQFGRHLLHRGVGVGDVVAISLPNSIAHLIASFGAWKAGASVLPLRHDLPPWERTRLFDLASPVAVIANDSDDPRTISSDELSASSDLDPSALNDRIPRWTRIIASSGSTGRPKLIVTPNPGLMDPQPALDVIHAGSQRPIQLGVSPFYHVMGWHCGGPAGVLGGNLSIVMEHFDASQAVDLIERHRVTTTILVPTMLMRIARLADITNRDFSSLETVMTGGASIPEWVVRAWLELMSPEKLTLSYGSTEDLGSVMTTGAQWLQHPGTTGRPDISDVKIVDADGKQVPTGTVGEIHLRPHRIDSSFEYLGVPTPRATSDGFRTLGDLGWVDDEGFLYVADRRDDLIVTGGANVFPAEVEAALSEHPAVKDQVVIGLDDPEWGRRVHAIVELEEQAEPATSEELRDFCRNRIAAYKVPKSFEIVACIQRTPAGKINRSKLMEERTSLAR